MTFKILVIRDALNVTPDPRSLVAAISGLGQVSTYHAGFCVSNNENAVSIIKEFDVILFLISKEFDPEVSFLTGCASGAGKPFLIVIDNFVKLPASLIGYRVLLRPSPHEVSLAVSAMLQQLDPARDQPHRSSVDCRHFFEMITVNPSLADEIPTAYFEEHVFRLFQDAGYEPVQHLSQSHPVEDGYADMYLKNYKGGTAIVEVKFISHNSKVTVSSVQQVAGALIVTSANKGIVVTNAEFTASARDFALRCEGKIELIDPHELLRIASSTSSLFD